MLKLNYRNEGAREDFVKGLAVALHRRDPAIQAIAARYAEGEGVGREMNEAIIVVKAWERNEGGSRDFYLKLAADVISDMEKGYE